MTKEEKIEAIYREIANKEKTIGCKYLVYATDEPEKIIEAVERGKDFSLYFGENDYAFIPTEQDYFRYYNIKEIIGKPVMIGDVIDWIEKKEFDISKPIPCFCDEEDEEVSDESKLHLIQDHYIDDTICYWGKKREPIEDQSEDCIDFIYSLLNL